MNKPFSYSPYDPLLTARQAAAELGIGVSTFWRDVRLGRWPAPYRPAPRAPRWRLSEIRAVLAFSMPTVGMTDATAKDVIAAKPEPK